MARESRPPPLRTPDGRYIIVRGRLWRTADPGLSDECREALVKALMDARREVGSAKRTGDREAEAGAHDRVDAAKHGLGERGPIWWSDGAPDLTRHLARTTIYAEWFRSITDT
jgi:hypothetical protein